jgi:hypothetical protein
VNRAEAAVFRHPHPIVNDGAITACGGKRPFNTNSYLQIKRINHVLEFRLETIQIATEFDI